MFSKSTDLVLKVFLNRKNLLPNKVAPKNKLNISDNNFSLKRFFSGKHLKPTIERKLIMTDIDLLKYPEIEKYPHTINQQFTIGDMHANTAKFLYFLIRQNFIQMNNVDFDRIVEIIVQLENSDSIRSNLTANNIKDYISALNNSKVIKNNNLARILGDEFFDRIGNDYLNYKIIEYLGLNNLLFEILASNHSIEILIKLENGLRHFLPRYVPPHCSKSAIRLNNLIESGLVARDEILDIIEKYYLPNLKLLSYSIDAAEENMTIYSHGRIGIKTIEALANEFLIKYADHTPQELAKTIDQINRVFLLIIKYKQFHQFYGGKLGIDSYSIPLTNPLFRTLNSRSYHIDPPIKKKYYYNLHFVHGHHEDGYSQECYRDFVTNLDNALGRKPMRGGFWGEYTVLVEKNISVAHHLNSDPSREKEYQQIKINFEKYGGIHGHPKDNIFYVVGKPISLKIESMGKVVNPLFRLSFYNKEAKNLKFFPVCGNVKLFVAEREAKIFKSFPEYGNVRLFITEREASNYARSLRFGYPFNDTCTQSAVFKVQLQKDIVLPPKTQEELNIPDDNLFLTLQMNQLASPTVTFFETDIKNVTRLNAGDLVVLRTEEPNSESKAFAAHPW